MRISSRLWVFALVLLVSGVPEGQAERSPAALHIRIDSPNPGELIQNKVNLAPIRGNAQAGEGGSIRFDVLLALDVSHSTRFPSGVDVDGDGEIGFNPQEELVAPGTYPDDVVCSDPDDTILAAELKAAEMLLEAIDPANTQVGVISFSGDVDSATSMRRSVDQQDAVVEIPLTRKYREVSAVLDRVRKQGPHGATNFAAAVRLAVVELANLPGARSRAREGARKIVLFLTDGNPTFPFGRATDSDPEDTEAALNAARLAHKAGITINTFALGRQALMSPLAVTEMARLTVGTFTPARTPGDILAFLQGVSFANVEDVVITNLTTREVSYDVTLAPDGSFSGFVPVREGKNVVQVTALATGGEERSVELDFDFKKSELSERELAVELERVKRRNRELLLLIERERIQKFRERQRRRIEIEAQEPDS